MKMPSWRYLATRTLGASVRMPATGCTSIRHRYSDLISSMMWGMNASTLIILSGMHEKARSEAAIASLPIIINGYKQSVQGTLDEPAVILLALLMDVGDLNKVAVKSFSSKAWEICRSHTEQLFAAYIRLKPEYDLNVLVYNGISPITLISCPFLLE